MRRRRMHRRGFTLIELLIVVAIIAVLAAIAVPNFLEAQTRAKVSSCKAGMRTLAIALESYAADNNAYPPYGRIDPVGTLHYPAELDSLWDVMYFAGPCLTTPVAYATAFVSDPFATRFTGHPLRKDIEYLNVPQFARNYPLPVPPYASNLVGAWGQWGLVAAGPDLDRGLDMTRNIVYDPTNGTVSDGDIIRCQQYPESKMNPNMPSL